MVAQHKNRVRGDVHAQLLLAGFDKGAHLFYRAVHHRRQVQRHLLDIDQPLRHARHIHQVIDQGGQLFYLAQNNRPAGPAQAQER